MEETSLPLSEQKLALKERELALKEEEIKAKIQLDKRGMIFSSPLLIALVSTVFGTAIGAGFQGYASLNVEQQKSKSSFELERQKFEFSLIQKALEETNREEAVKQLIFLVDSGVIKDLEAEKIKRIAEEKTEELPTITPNKASDDVLPRVSGVVTGNSDAQVPIRTTPDETSPPIYEVAGGNRITILTSAYNATNELWYEVRIDSVNRRGWISSKQVNIDQL